MRSFPWCLYRPRFGFPGLRAMVPALIAGGLALELAAGRAAAVGYTVTDLGSLGGRITYANGLNNLGQVVAFFYDGTATRLLGT